MLKLPWTRPAFLIGLLLLLLGWQLAGPLPSGRVTLLAWQQGRVSADTLWLAWWQLRLPRLAATVLAGAALGMAGHLLQSLSRNPLASPSVLGVTAGAQLGLIVAVLLPAGMALAAVPAVFGGGLLAVALCFVVAGGWQAHPLTLVLAGTVVSLLLSAVVSLLMVLFDQHVAGVALWSAGSLFQNGWQGVQTVLPWFLLACVLAWRYRAALPLLALGDDSAASLGLDVGRSRRRLLLVATLLSAVAVTLAGPVALVGLMAPNLLRLAGLQHPRRLLPASALAGAILLALADPIADWLADTSRSLLPLGVATALAGTPLLLWLIGRQGHLSLPPPAATAWQPYCHARRTASWLLPLCLLLLCVAPGVSFTQYVQAWQQPDALADWWLTLRLPRVLLAAGCGALLACSGVLLQGVVRNPLAGPELMGLSQGAALMVLAGLAMLGSVSPWGRLLLALLGSGIVLLVLLAISRRHAWAPLQLALAGMALATLGGALASLLVAQAKLQVAQAVTWLAGSTYGRGWDEVSLLAWAMVCCLPPALYLARALDLLALGDEVAASLGLAVGRSRGLALLLAAVCSAAAVAVAGPVGFVGLVAPHLALLLGGRNHRNRLWLALLLGMVLGVLADWLGRSLLQPRDMPFGIVTALLGAPYFLCLLAAQRQRRVA